MKASTRRHGTRDGDGIGAYLASLRGVQPLSREDEHRLAVKARAGDVAARQRLAQGALAFVVAIARKQRRGAVGLEDVIQEGNLGLMRAAEKFDPDAGTRFSTYAAWWIRAFIGKYLRQARSSVRPRSGTIAFPDLSLDTPVDGENETTHLDRLEDGAAGPEDAFLANEVDSEVRIALGQARERVGEIGWQIIHERLLRDDQRTLGDIGKRWGLSRERIRQLELQTKEILAGRLQEGDERDAA